MKVTFFGCFAAVMFAISASAQVVRFDGIDAGAGPGDPRPDSDSAAAAFDLAAAALGNAHLLDFEGLALGNFGALEIAPGVTATKTGTDIDGGIVADGMGFWGTEALGYNTTAGGARFLGFEPLFSIGTATLEFAFDEPIRAFGAYLTGLGTADGNLFVEFDDGSEQTLPVGGDPNGGVLFFGFTDAGAEIVSVTLVLSEVVSSRDIFGLDDLRWVGPPCVSLDFETDDEGQPLVHGQHLGDGDAEFDGGPVFPVTISSSVVPSGGSTAAILDATAGPAFQDPDLLVGSGKILILQTDLNTSECPPASGIYCTHNDDEEGGRLSFAWAGSISPVSLALIDCDTSDTTWSAVLTDAVGARRTYTVPPDWTGDFVDDGPLAGRRTLVLTTLTDQPGFGSTATATEDPGFDPLHVVRLDVHLGGSGGLDDLSWCATDESTPRASVERRNGMGVNRVSLASATLPRLGGTWATTLDCRAFASGVATLSLRLRPTSGTITPFGEELISGVLVRRASQGFAGSASHFTWNVPNDSALIGLSLHAQGSCRSNSTSSLPNVLHARGGLSNALDLILGY